MRPNLATIFISIILASCSVAPTKSQEVTPKTQTYDIDVTCNDQTGGSFVICDPLQKEECNSEMTRYDCYSPVFHIKCDRKTAQILGNVHTCTTHDEKSVRVTVETNIPTDDDFNKMFREQ